MALRNTERSGNKWKARGEPNAEWNFGFWILRLNQIGGVKAIKAAIMGVSGVEGASGGGSKKIRKKKHIVLRNTLFLVSSNLILNI